MSTVTIELQASSVEILQTNIDSYLQSFSPKQYGTMFHTPTQVGGTLSHPEVKWVVRGQRYKTA